MLIARFLSQLEVIFVFIAGTLIIFLLFAEQILNQTPSERPTMSEVLASDWLSNVPPMPPSLVDQSYVLQPTVVPYKPPTEPPAELNYSEVEKTARER